MPAIGISILALLMAALVARASGWRVGVGIFAILAFEYFIAAQGVLKQWERLPPALMVMMAVLVILTLLLAFSGRLDHLSTGVIVLSQAFRLPLELVMHQAYADGLMPKQMSFSGRRDGACGWRAGIARRGAEVAADCLESAGDAVAANHHGNRCRFDTGV